MIKLSLILALAIIKTNQQEIKWMEARPGEFPFMVWLTTRVDASIGKGEKATCVGSLISTSWVLIDAICGSQFKISQDVVIPVESGVIPDKSEGINVVKKIVHEGYRKYIPPGARAYLALANSIALLKLAKPVDMSQGFAPLNLPTGPLTRDVTVLKPTWKANDAVAEFHEIKLLPWSTCQMKYRSHNSYYYTNAQGMICSQERLEDVPTTGPFIIKGKSPSEAIVAGLLTKDDPVNSNKRIYIATDVGMYREWIKQKTGI